MQAMSPGTDEIRESLDAVGKKRVDGMSILGEEMVPCYSFSEERVSLCPLFRPLRWKVSVYWKSQGSRGLCLKHLCMFLRNILSPLASTQK